MRIVITGGAGFLGVRLARALLARDTLTDARGAARPIARARAARRRAAAGSRRFARARSDRRSRRSRGHRARRHRAIPTSIFHLAAVVSGQAEADFDIGMRVNLDATRLLLERCRRLAAPPKFVFASSLAVFGGPLPDPGPRRRAADAAGVLRHAKGDRRIPGLRHDAQGLHRRPQPAAADRHRAARQAEQGRVVVRERHHPRAAGRRRRDLPGGARRRGCGCTSPRAVIANLIIGPRGAGVGVRAHALGQRAGDPRSGRKRWSPRCASVAGDAVADRVKWQFDPAIDRIVATWASNFAPKLGPRAGDDERHRFREHRPRVHRGRHARKVAGASSASP